MYKDKLFKPPDLKPLEVMNSETEEKKTLPTYPDEVLNELGFTDDFNEADEEEEEAEDEEDEDYKVDLANKTEDAGDQTQPRSPLKKRTPKMCEKCRKNLELGFESPHIKLSKVLG